MGCEVRTCNLVIAMRMPYPLSCRSDFHHSFSLLCLTLNHMPTKWWNKVMRRQSTQLESLWKYCNCRTQLQQLIVADPSANWRNGCIITVIFASKVSVIWNVYCRISKSITQANRCHQSSGSFSHFRLFQFWIHSLIRHSLKRPQRQLIALQINFPTTIRLAERKAHPVDQRWIVMQQLVHLRVSVSSSSIAHKKQWRR